MITLSASTLGTPGDTLTEVLETLAGHGVPGLELRLSGGQIVDPAMTVGARREVRDQIDAAGCVVTGIASYVRVAAAAADEMVVGALVAAVDVAADLGAGAVRVFPGAPTEPAPYDEVPELTENRDEVDERAARRLSAAVPYATDRGVLLCLETHDSHPSGRLVAGVLERVDGPVGAVWDLMHPWRVGERLQESWDALAPWLGDDGGFVQVKDARLPASRTPLPIGSGTLPTAEFADLLVAEHYAGPLSLEWERTWHPEAVPLAEALPSFRAWADRHWPPALSQNS